MTQVSTNRLIVCLAVFLIIFQWAYPAAITEFVGRSTQKVLKFERAPLTIMVGPAIIADGVTKFNSIQAAIDSVGNDLVQPTVIQVLPGTYTENVVAKSIHNSDPSKLQIIGDTRRITGYRIRHGCSWRCSGGWASFDEPDSAVISISFDAVTVSVNNGIPPDFAAEGVVPGDEVFIETRDSNNTVTTHTVASVSMVPGVSSTLHFTAPIKIMADEQVYAMTIGPRVKIQPKMGAAFTINDAGLLFTGFLLCTPSSEGNGFTGIGPCQIEASRILIFGDN